MRNRNVDDRYVWAVLLVTALVLVLSFISNTKAATADTGRVIINMTVPGTKQTATLSCITINNHQDKEYK